MKFIYFKGVKLEKCIFDLISTISEHVIVKIFKNGLFKGVNKNGPFWICMHIVSRGLFVIEILST